MMNYSASIRNLFFGKIQFLQFTFATSIFFFNLRASKSLQTAEMFLRGLVFTKSFFGFGKLLDPSLNCCSEYFEL